MSARSIRGGDYKTHEYKERDVVVDNPPFSILSEIVSFYLEKGIKFFLFAPALTLFSGASQDCCALCAGVNVTYENGAQVLTSFLTNFETARFRSCPDLYKRASEADEKNRAENRRVIPKYEYPDCVVKATDINKFSKYGVGFSVGRDESHRITALASQKEVGKAIFGSGYLISERAAAERAAAERAAAENEALAKITAAKWTLNEQELEIVRNLGK